jgi:YVTN family beta-propeller protein
MRKYLQIILLFVGIAYTFFSCKTGSNTAAPADGNYPPQIANILVNRCATTGCHNAATKAAGLSLDTWEHLFQGSLSGADVVPYCTEYSYLLYRVCTDSTLGSVILPSQPPTIDPTKPAKLLSNTEYLTLANWIAKGAPDKYGNIPFGSDPDTRQKIYLTQQGSDLVTVIDAKSMLVMRYIPVGIDPNLIESPHGITISADGKSAYVCFYAGAFVQKIDTRSDTVVATLNIGNKCAVNSIGSWNIIISSPAEDTAVLTSNIQLDNGNDGTLALLRANPFSLEHCYGSLIDGINFSYPHGLVSNYAFDTFYVTSEWGNVIYRFHPKDISSGHFIETLTIDSLSPTTSPSATSLDPHEVELSPDGTKMFIACQNSNEVRVMDLSNNQIIKIIPVGAKPQEFALSYQDATPYLFVTCMEDANNPNPINKGSVYVINYNTYQIVKIIYGDFYQPHDICVDDINNLIFIPSTNLNPNGPAPHHCLPGTCHPGWYSVYSLTTLERASSTRYEVPANPYSIGIRFSE